MMNLQRVADLYLAECFARESPPHVNELACRLGMSATALRRAFASTAGTPLAAYLKSARLVRAQELLRNTGLGLNTVAYACAFGTRVTFFRTFKQATGMTPQEYRMTARSTGMELMSACAERWQLPTVSLAEL